MRILGINGSPRGEKSMTLKLVKSVLEGANEAGAEVELVDLCNLNIEYCNACAVCYRTGKCTKEDDFEELYEKILESNGLVLGSPVYFNSVTAQLKTVIDRLSDAVHCQLLHGKYGCSVATSGCQGHQMVAEYMNNILTALGANTVGIAGAAMIEPSAMETAEDDAFKLGQSLVKSIEDNTIFLEQEEIHKVMRERFGELVTKNKDLWTHEYDHWLMMGWIEEES